LSHAMKVVSCELSRSNGGLRIFESEVVSRGWELLSTKHNRFCRQLHFTKRVQILRTDPTFGTCSFNSSTIKKHCPRPDQNWKDEEYNSHERTITDFSNTKNRLDMPTMPPLRNTLPNQPPSTSPTPQDPERPQDCHERKGQEST